MLPEAVSLTNPHFRSHVENSWKISEGSNYRVDTISFEGEVVSEDHFSRNTSYGYTLTHGLLTSPNGIVFIDDRAVVESDFRGGGGVQDTVPMVRAWPQKVRARIRQSSSLGRHLVSSEPKHFTFAPYGNFYHFLIESVPNLLLARESFPNLLVLLPNSSPQFVKNLLSNLEFRLLELPNGSWNVNSLVILERNSNTPISIEALEALKSLLTDTDLRPPIPRSKIYVSRVGSIRQLRNEEALEEFLANQGFDVLRSSDLSDVLKNAQIFNRAELVIGPHGAGLANLAFCRPGTVVLEIASKNFWLPLYSALAKSAKLSHFLVFLDTFGIEDFGEANDAITRIKRFLNSKQK